MRTTPDEAVLFDTRSIGLSLVPTETNFEGNAWWGVLMAGTGGRAELEGAFDWLIRDFDVIVSTSDRDRQGLFAPNLFGGRGGKSNIPLPFSGEGGGRKSGNG